MTIHEARVGMRVRHKLSRGLGRLGRYSGVVGNVQFDNGNQAVVWLSDIEPVQTRPAEILEATLAAFARGKEQVAV